ncbi:hypothetical protein ABH940_005361 [Streptacidiphilus sp. BW17]
MTTSPEVRATGRPFARPTTPRPAPMVRLFARRCRALLWFALCVAQVWALHTLHLIRCRLRRRAPDAGMTTAEYAVGTVAACGFAALLYKIVTSGAVSSALQGLIRRALGAV